MLEIVRYELPVDGAVIEIAQNALFLRIGELDSALYLWAEVDSEEKAVERLAYVIVNTGHRIDRDTDYIFLGSAHMTKLEMVFFVYGKLLDD